MIRAFIKCGDGSVVREGTGEAIARALADPGAVFWVDISGPTEEEIGVLRDVFKFHPLAIEDVAAHVQRPKLERYAEPGDVNGREYFYLVVHAPDVETFRARLRTDELDVFLSERYLVTVHEKEVKSPESALVRVERDPKAMLDLGIDVILYQVLDRMVDMYLPILDEIEKDLDDLEERAAERPEPELLPCISSTKRDLLTLRRIIGPQRDVIAQLTRGEVPCIREGTRIYLRDVQDHLNRAVETIELYRDLVLGARDIYMSSISNNLNQIMKTLTIISVVALPMTVVTSFFGMNFESIPGLHSRMGFWGAVGVMMIFVAGFLWWFRRKGWL
jgi:magnesium transporter